MSWKPDKTRAICPQLCERVCVKIAAGELLPGERLPSVRDIAVNTGVNPNTVQKALELLEVKGLIYSVRGSGWYVGEDVSVAKETAQALIDKKVNAFYLDMKALGLNKEQIINYVKETEE